jgi:hypothetical protein
MSIWINDRPLSAFVTAITGLDGYLAPDAPARELVALANSAAIVGSTVTVSPRTITVTVDIATATLLDRQTMLDALARQLRGRLLFRTADRPTREIGVVCQGTGLTFYDGALSVVACSVTLTLVAADPVWVDREPRLYALSTSRAALPVGTATSAPVVVLNGASPSVVNPAIIVRDASGAETHRLALTGVLATNDWIEIDSAAQTLTRYVAGVVQAGGASGMTWLTSGTFPILDPSGAIDGTGIGMDLTATSGTPTGLILYKRAWS